MPANANGFLFWVLQFEVMQIFLCGCEPCHFFFSSSVVFQLCILIWTCAGLTLVAYMMLEKAVSSQRARSLVPLSCQSVWNTDSSVKLFFPLLDLVLSKYMTSLPFTQRSFYPYPQEESQISLILCICAVIKLHFYY